MTKTLAIGLVTTFLYVPQAGPAEFRQGLQGLEVELRQFQAQLAEPQLDASLIVPSLNFVAAPAKDVMSAIAAATGLAIRYDQAGPDLDKPRTVNLTNVSLPDAVNIVLGPNNALTFKVLGPKSILVYVDTSANRQKYAESVRVFRIQNGDPARITQMLVSQAALSTGDGIRPVIVAGRTSSTIMVRATAEKMAEIEKFIAANDRR